jgi:hypothetical protein
MITFFLDEKNQNKNDNASRFRIALLKEDALELESIFGEIFNYITPQDDMLYKWYYLALLNVSFLAFGLDARPGVKTHLGQADIDIVMMDNIYTVIKLKYEKGDIGDDQTEQNRLLDKAVNNALKYIEKKKLGAYYQLRASRIIKMGVGIYGKGLVRVKFTH